jgi:vacuolar-type H+-ATPase subunit I/STV1
MDFFEGLLCEDLTLDELDFDFGRNRRSVKGNKEDGCINDFDVEKNELAVKEIKFHISCAMGLIGEVPNGTIQSVLEGYGFKINSENETRPSFHARYESLRKKISRTSYEVKRLELIRELCRLYIDHDRTPKSTFKYVNQYNKMKTELWD